MLDNSIFKKPVWIYTVDGYKRSWKTLWLVREPILTRVFIGFVNTIRKDYQGTVLELVNEEWRRWQKPYIEDQEEKYKNAKFLRPHLYKLEEV